MVSSRRESRYKIELPITLTAGRRVVHLMTEDVSFRGVFLRTDVPLALRQLVQVELHLPPHSDRFAATGMLVHAIPRSEDGRAPGVGLQFYGVGRERQAAWDRFINYVRDQFPEAGEPAVVVPRADVYENAQRQFERRSVVLRVQVKTVEDLLSMYSRDISKGGMFLWTDRPFEVGDELALQVVHPNTEEIFDIACTVRRVVRQHESCGIGVEFTQMDEDARKRFYEFIYDAIAILFDEESVRDDEPDTDPG